MPLGIVDLRDLIKQDFDPEKVREVDNSLIYEGLVPVTFDSKRSEDYLKKKFLEFAGLSKEVELDYQIFVRTSPTLAIEEKVAKTFVVYSNGTVWLHLIKDFEEANRVLQCISPTIKKAEKKDLKRLCGEGGLSRWSYIKRSTEAKPEKFKIRMKKLIDSKHYTSVETRSMLGSFGVKYKEERALEFLPKPKGVLIRIVIRDLFCQKMDVLKAVEDFLSL